MQITSGHDFPSGTTFKTRDKHPRVCTVIDRWNTFNRAGELVRVRYVATHEFLGQTITDYDVVPVTIARGLVSCPSH